MFCPDLMLISSGGVVASEKLTSATSSHTLKARSKHFLRHFLVMVDTVQYQYWLSVHMQESYFPTEDPKTTASQWTKMSTVQMWQWLTWPSQCQSGFWQSDLGTVPWRLSIRKIWKAISPLWGTRWADSCPSGEEGGRERLLFLFLGRQSCGSQLPSFQPRYIPKLEEHPRKQLTVRSSTLWCRGVSTVWNIRTFLGTVS